MTIKAKTALWSNRTMRIRLDRVSKSFDGGVRYAVRDVDLAVEDGERVILVGESGSGKTTALKTINRLVRPTSGTVTVDGADVRSLDPVLLRRSIGYVFQGIGLFPHLTVAENVGVVPTLLGDPKPRVSERVRELLDLVDLPYATFGTRFPDALSGGQRQRVGVARALGAAPRLVLMDEPFGALDPLTREQLQGEVLRLQERLGFTLLLVTHDVAEAFRLAERVGVMKDGHLARIGTPRELLRDPGHPYVADLMRLHREQAARVAEQDRA